MIYRKTTDGFLRVGFLQGGSARRTAFSLLELIVVIVVTGILLSVLLVAVQAARGAARRAQCVNQIKQLTLAAHQFEGQFGIFPPASTRYRGYGPGTYGPPSVEYASGMWRLLPFLGYDELATQVKEVNPLRGAYDYRRTRLGGTFVPGLICPADGYQEGTTYRFCSGSNPFADEISQLADDQLPDGAFGFFARRFSDISGGTSYTACFSERRIGHRGARFDGRADTIGQPLISLLGYGDLTRDRLHQIAAAFHASPPHNYFPSAGRQWHFAGKQFVLYDHVFPPSAPISGIVSSSNRLASFVHTGAVGATSYHADGVNLSRLDGAVGFVSASVDPLVWRRLGSIHAGAEAR